MDDFASKRVKTRKTASAQLPRRVFSSNVAYWVWFGLFIDRGLSGRVKSSRNLSFRRCKKQEGRDHQVGKGRTNVGAFGIVDARGLEYMTMRLYWQRPQKHQGNYSLHLLRSVWSRHADGYCYTATGCCESIF